MKTRNRTRSFGTQSITVPPTGPYPGWFQYVDNRPSNWAYPMAWRGNAPNPITIHRRSGESSSMSDTTGASGAFQPCKHLRTRWTCEANPENLGGFDSQHSEVTSNPQYSTAPYAGSYYHAKYYDSLFVAEATKEVIPSFTWEATSLQALQAMLPSLVGDVSLPNFLFELRDFSSLWRAATTRWRGPIETLKNIVGAAWSQKVGDKPAQRLASGYLAYQFAWRPFISDVQALVLDLYKIRERIREVIQRANTPQQRYWGTWLPGTDVGETTKGYLNIEPTDRGIFGPHRSKGRVRVYRRATQGVRYHASLRYRYPVPSALLAPWGQVKALLDTLGINGNPAMLWNAVRFTFIIDWFVNVGRYLEQFTQPNVRFQTELLDFCHSVKYQRQIEYHVASMNRVRYSGVIDNWIHTDTCTLKLYERRVGIPALGTAISTSGLSPREFLLGGALVAARR